MIWSIFSSSSASVNLTDSFLSNWNMTNNIQNEWNCTKSAFQLVIFEFASSDDVGTSSVHTVGLSTLTSEDEIFFSRCSDTGVCSYKAWGSELPGKKNTSCWSFQSVPSLTFSLYSSLVMLICLLPFKHFVRWSCVFHRGTSNSSQVWTWFIRRPNFVSVG